MQSPTNIGVRSPAAATPPDLDPLSCEWGPDLRAVGIESRLPAAYRIGVSALALTILGGAILAALLDSSPGARPGLLALGLVLAAGAPWALWLARDDDGPSWIFAASVLVPVAALGIGRWTAAPIDLGSDLAYGLVAALVLLLVLLYAAFARPRMAAGVAAAAFAVVAAPRLAGWVRSEEDLSPAAALTWLAGFAFCIVAGYAGRLGYVASRQLAEAREALAWQAAAEQRRRVAQDVHDVVAHTLAITMLHITAARMAVRRAAPVEAEEALVEAERHGRASLNDIRRIVRLLRSDDVTAVDAAQPGLADVEALTESYRAAGLPVTLSPAIDGERTSPTAELALYRVLQEALANAARHGSGPTTVELRVTGGAISLNVANPLHHQTPRPSPGSGLLGMRERVAAAGGTVEAGARDGRWVVRAVVPSGAGA